MMHVPLGDTYYFKFTTRQFSTGAPFTLAGTPVISVYEENNLVQITAGITLTVDYDGVTGLNDVAIVATTANGYEVGKYYSAVVTTGTVNSVSVVGEVVGHFRVMPAEDAGAGIPDVNAVAWLDTAVTLSATSAKPEVDTFSLSDDATAANNAESFFDGTGYAGTNNVIPTVTTLTGHTAQTGDAYSLLNTAAGEPGQGAPPVSASPVTKITYLYKDWRNKKTQTATEYAVYADDATTVDQKATVSDDGTTFTRGELASGP